MIDPDELAAADETAAKLLADAQSNVDTITPRSGTYRGQEIDDADARALAIASAVLALVAEVRVARLTLVDATARAGRRSKT